jgi:hypothetical protein
VDWIKLAKDLIQWWQFHEFCNKCKFSNSFRMRTRTKCGSRWALEYDLMPWSFMSVRYSGALTHLRIHAKAME